MGAPLGLVLEEETATVLAQYEFRADDEDDGFPSQLEVADDLRTRMTQGRSEVASG